MCRKMFDSVSEKKTAYRLQGMVCYYMKHYNAFFKLKNRVWVVFDDVTVKKVKKK